MNIIVVGAGISGLAIARALQARAPDARVTVLESSWRSGGKIQTEQVDGFTIEWGPNGFLDNAPATLALAHDLSLDDSLVLASAAARKRFVVWGGALHRLPESPLAFLRSTLLSRRGRARVLCEPFARRTPQGLEPTVAEFGARRLGREAVERLLDPMVSGIYAGDPNALSVQAAFPKIAALERTYGSLARGMIATARERRKMGGAAVTTGPGGTLRSFRGGLEELTTRLRGELGVAVIANAHVTALEPLADDRLLVITADGQSRDADRVVLAIPAYAAADLVLRHAPDAAPPLRAIPFAAVAVVALAYRRASLRCDLDGFGFLAPHAAGRRILGCLWDSSIFPGSRAPDGFALLRVLLGGVRAGELVDRTDGELTDIVRGELRALLQIDAAPEFVRIARHARAIPQYTVGHRERVLAAEQALATALPGVILAGNAYRGAALNDCVANADTVAHRALAGV